MAKSLMTPFGFSDLVLALSDKNLRINPEKQKKRCNIKNLQKGSGCIQYDDV
jgi:hypothetical protein